MPQSQSAASETPSPPKQSRQEQQLEFIQHRQVQFREAALHAKRNGDTDLAKRYLLQSKVRKPLLIVIDPIFLMP